MYSNVSQCSEGHSEPSGGSRKCLKSDRKGVAGKAFMNRITPFVFSRRDLRFMNRTMTASRRPPPRADGCAEHGGDGRGTRADADNNQVPPQRAKDAQRGYRTRDALQVSDRSLAYSFARSSLSVLCIMLLDLKAPPTVGRGRGCSAGVRDDPGIRFWGQRALLGYLERIG